MGRNGGKRFGKGRGRGRGGGHRAQRADYDEVPKHNELFEQYYNELRVITEDEREDFWDALGRDLPNSFRFAGSKGHALAVQQRLKDHYIPEIVSIKHNGEFVEPPTALPWYPNQLAWQMTTPKSVVRKFPPFASFQKYLVSETSVGNISRQEAVSMIPPLLMDVHPGMTVLDLCAAPGSKTAQLLEMVHGGEEARTREVVRRLRKQEGRQISPDGIEIKFDLEEEERMAENWSDDGRTTGLLIANDADYKRAHMLIHQMKRLNSPNLIVTNHDATIYPSIKLPSDSIYEGGIPKGKYLKFDRILADVPCSGDGTCRKNANVWKDWNPGNALGLFNVQLRILIRALTMLKVGGRVVYSTCSMNPVENEAVVASAIRHCGGISKVDLIDCSNALPELKRRPGLTFWKVMDKMGKIWDNWGDLEKQREEEGDYGTERVVQNMFPPTKSSKPDTSLPLKRCMRVYPHLQDTGGFFIAVLEKKLGITVMPEESKKIENRSEDSAPKSSIIAAVDEIEAMPTNGASPMTRIKALDDIAPPQATDEADNPSAAARQNKENLVEVDLSSQKHELEDIADAAMSTKRPRFREEIDEAAPRGLEERQVHWPPPPGAELELTRPEAASSSKPNLPAYQHKKKPIQPVEEPFKYLDPDHETLRIIYQFYQLHERFPRDRFMVRNASGIPAKTIYYTSTLAKNILTENEGKGMKFVHCGVKMFVKQDVQRPGVCQWRIQTDGLPILESWVGENRVVELTSKRTLKNLLVEMFPRVSYGGWEQLREIGQRARDIEMGCCVLRVEPSEGSDGFSERLVLPLWRSLHSLNLMLPKEERRAMLLRIYNDDSPLEDHSKDRFAVGTKTEVDVKGEDSRAEEDEMLDADTEEPGKDIEEEGIEEEDLKDENAGQEVNDGIINKIAAVDDLGPPGPDETEVIGISGLGAKGGEDAMMQDQSLSVEQQA